MRYSTDHKAGSRRRILSSASAKLRSRGAAGVTVADVMTDAGLTHGGFYRHFPDREALVGEAYAHALDEVASRLEALVAGRPRTQALRAVIEHYLSEEHLLHPDRGCAIAAAGADVARLGPACRDVVNASLATYSASVAPLLPGDTAQRRQRDATVLFASMAGCMAVARARTTPDEQREVLTDARDAFMRMFAADDAGTVETPR